MAQIEEIPIDASVEPTEEKTLEVEEPVKPVPPLKQVLPPKARAKGRPSGAKDKMPRVIKKVKAQSEPAMTPPVHPPRSRKQQLFDSWFE